MNKFDEFDRLAKLKQDAADIQKLIVELESKVKRFKPNIGGVFWSITAELEIKASTQCMDGSLFSSFNCYETKELAIKAAVMMKRSNAIIMACLMVDPDFVPDYKRGNQEHYSFFHNPVPAVFGGGWVMVMNKYYNAGPCVSTQEKWNEAAALLTEWGVE